jgi:hypothetical protein
MACTRTRMARMARPSWTPETEIRLGGTDGDNDSEMNSDG